MASQKEKYLNSAQKFLQKGQLDRAVREYEMVVAADPKDVRHRQKLAELLARCNRSEDALREYQTIAAYYEESGFYLKAIAVYKQIQKIDPRNIDISFTLAALNEKQGLVGNALSEYKSIFDHYEKEGLSTEACRVLEKMHAVDPGNADIQLKLAETLYAAGKHDEAHAEYSDVAARLKNLGKEELHERVCARMKALFPERGETPVEIADGQTRDVAGQDAVAVLSGKLQGDPENPELLSLLADAYRERGMLDRSKEILNRLLKLQPSENFAKQALISCCLEEGDVENTLILLDRFAPDLIAAGMHLNLENFYTMLQGKAPYDMRVLEGLKYLYEKVGDHAKLAEIQVSLNIVSGTVSEAQSSFPVQSAEGAATIIELEELPEMAETESSTWKGGEISLESEGFGNDMDIPGLLAADSDPYAISLDDLDVMPETSGDGEHGFQAQTSEGFAMQSTAEEPPSAFAPEDFDPDSLFIDPGSPLLEVEFEEEVAASPAAAGDRGLASLLLEEEVVEDNYSPGSTLDKLVKDLGRDFVKEDTETHFNLGIAYKEMGLYDEAMKEFKAAAVDPERTVDSLILQGICLRDTGDFTRAEETLRAGIHLFTHDAEKSLNLKYELGLLYELSGRTDDALGIFRDVFAENPGFRDTAMKITRLHGSGDLPDFSDIDERDIDLEV